jgi:hypothetical protein
LKFNCFINSSSELISSGVCSPTVRIIAFQAIDPGSTPGRRTSNVLCIFFFSSSNFLCISSNKVFVTRNFHSLIFCVAWGTVKEKSDFNYCFKVSREL